MIVCTHDPEPAVEAETKSTCGSCGSSYGPHGCTNCDAPSTALSSIQLSEK